MEKVCCRCKASKPLSEFWKYKKSKDGHNGACIECLNGPGSWNDRNREYVNAKQRERYALNSDRARAYNLAYLYGVTLEWYEAQLQAQGGRCAICGYVPKEGQRRLAVDHNHYTNKIRELLCQRCNLSVGYMREDPRLIRKMADYLESHT